MLCDCIISMCTKHQVSCSKLLQEMVCELADQWYSEARPVQEVQHSCRIEWGGGKQVPRSPDMPEWSLCWDPLVSTVWRGTTDCLWWLRCLAPDRNMGVFTSASTCNGYVFKAEQISFSWTATCSGVRFSLAALYGHLYPTKPSPLRRWDMQQSCLGYMPNADPSDRWPDQIELVKVHADHWRPLMQECFSYIILMCSSPPKVGCVRGSALK